MDSCTTHPPAQHGVAPTACLPSHCQQLREELERHLAAASTGELVREGVRVAIVGPPNAGGRGLFAECARRASTACSLLKLLWGPGVVEWDHDKQASLRCCRVAGGPDLLHPAECARSSSF